MCLRLLRALPETTAFLLDRSVPTTAGLRSGARRSRVDPRFNCTDERVMGCERRRGPRFAIGASARVPRPHDERVRFDECQELCEIAISILVLVLQIDA